jgi:dimethylamine/trimethylamine dehydrogenase
LAAIHLGSVLLTDGITGRESQLPCDHLLLVTDRVSQDHLYYDLKPALVDGRLTSLKVIGDAQAPHLIAQAVYSGHLAAREFDEPVASGTPFRREYPIV